MVIFTDINPLYFILAMAPVGMAFPFIAAAGLGLQGLSALFNRESQASKDLKKSQTRLANSQAKLAKGRSGRETQLFGQAQPIISTVTQELQALLSGDRAALTKRFAPSLQALTGQREAAQKRIEQSGVQGGASVQAGLELEKSAFSERSRLLSSAPAEAQAGLTQLLELLLGTAASQATAGTAAASVAGAALESNITAERGTRALNANLLSALSEGAEEFGAIFAKKPDENKVFNL